MNSFIVYILADVADNEAIDEVATLGFLNEKVFFPWLRLLLSISSFISFD